MRRIVESVLLAGVAVLMIPFILLCVVLDLLQAFFLWCRYGSAWGNWRDRA